MSLAGVELHQANTDRKGVVVKRRPVEQIDLETNKVIAKFLTPSHAADVVSTAIRADGSHIIKVCLGKRESAYGYKWRYAKT